MAALAGRPVATCGVESSHFSLNITFMEKRTAFKRAFILKARGTGDRRRTTRPN